MTTKPLKIRAEILTVNGIVPITYRVSAGGIYPLDNGVRYLNLDELLKTKAIKFVGEEIPEVREPVVEEPDSPATSDPNLVSEDSDSDEQSEESSDESDVNPESDEVVMEPDSPEEPAKSESQTSSVAICPHCGGEFASERGLKRHISSAHPSQK